MKTVRVFEKMTPDALHKLRQRVLVFWSDLTEFERQVLEFRMGLRDGCSRTTEETGEWFGLPSAQVRQIEQKIFEKFGFTIPQASVKTTGRRARKTPLTNARVHAIIHHGFADPDWARKVLAESEPEQPTEENIPKMGKYTIEQLQAAIGENLRLVPCGADTKARIQRPDGEDVAILDFAEQRITSRLAATWDEKALAKMPSGVPTPEVIAEARQEILEELQSDWERAGFLVQNDGVIDGHDNPGQPGTKLPIYVVVATKSVPTLTAAVETLVWIRPGWCLTTLQM